MTSPISAPTVHLEISRLKGFRDTLIRIGKPSMAEGLSNIIERLEAAWAKETQFKLRAVK